MTNRLWFRAKTYGYGWTPNTWQGWSITALFILAVIGLFGNIDSTSHSVSDTLISFALPFVSLLIFYIIICILKGEKPRWRWGMDK